MGPQNGQMAMNNNMASDCGCDGSTPNVDVLNRNLNMAPNNNMQPQQVQLVNNIAQNQKQIHDNMNLNNLIAPIQDLKVLGSTPIQKNEDTKFCRKEIRVFLYVLLALSINEMFKYFINQSIRLNKASSNRYIFYPLAILAILVVVCLC